jgi:hypothetical protein
MNILFPVIAIKRGDTLRPYRFHVKAIRIDADPSWMGSRNIPGLDAAMSTKEVLRDASIERVGMHVILTTQEFEIAPGHEEMQETCHTTDAAVALCQLEICRCGNFEPDAATMAAATVNSHGRPPSLLQTTRLLFAGIA